MIRLAPTKARELKASFPSMLPRTKATSGLTYA